MAWQAVPGRGFPSDEDPRYIANVKMINKFFNKRKWTLQAQAGMLGNFAHEGGMNPWSWENITVNMSRGYGLYQRTPASAYIDDPRCKALTNYGPNTSVTEVVEGAKPEDGEAQLEAFVNKWMGWEVPSGCWRTYWDEEQYPELLKIRQELLTKYGTDGKLSMEQFSKIKEIDLATFAYLAAFEGPVHPSFGIRYQSALKLYPLLSKPMPVYMMCGRKF